jgi:sirohydrochlorin ferrochelatase
VTGQVLVAVAHGSSHPEAVATFAALARQVSRLAPVIDMRVAYVQHATPSLADALAAAGPDPVVVPLLLSSGYHLSTDVGGQDGRIAGLPAPRAARPLGPDPLLTTALVSRLREADVPAGTPVVLAAAGSSDPAAAEQVADQAALLAAELDTEVVAAFAASGRPDVPEAVAELASRTRRPVAVASYLLAPGVFHDRLLGAGAAWVTAPLGDHPAVAALVIDRYRTGR